MKKEPDKRLFVVEAIARTACAVHRLPADLLRFLDGHPDAKAHVEAQRGALSPEDLAEDPDARQALQWIEGHSCKERLAVVLHGDLLPQNILWDWEEDKLGVVDWEFAQIGDPAYDLAIVTRGSAKLCGLRDGVRRLVDAYRQAGGTPVTPADVTTHELLLVLSWFGDAAKQEREGRRGGQPPEYYRDQIRAILHRADPL